MTTGMQELIARRRATGADLYDEIWDGEYHLAPAAHPFHGYLDGQMARVFGPLAERVGLVEIGPFNLGTPDNVRMPDRGLHRELPTVTLVPSGWRRWPRPFAGPSTSPDRTCPATQT